ncbi:TIGR04104 family putative zinc finger protein [Clostridium hydrogeniformans]|uniref:TIGR04104 family putative zinc finger protein n=1 Tax=Clostridium hydrogeniformans TaxID=349933 RepID=UPI0004870225|nr:TIGR04104 family putative zinc finger protein [Clostridium hydrogeniformans]
MQKKFSYIELLSSTFQGYKSIKCKSCNSRFRINELSRWSISALIPLLVILFKDYLLSLGKTNAMLVLGLYIVIIILISPFLAKYKQIDENK